MSYIRGASAAKEAVERERAEVERLYAEGRALAQTAKQLRERNANIEAKLAEERERLQDRRATLTRTLADIEAAQAEADRAIRDAEQQAATIRELAYDQARALAERAYKSGYDKGRDYARAQHATLNKVLPTLMRRTRQAGVTTDERGLQPKVAA